MSHSVTSANGSVNEKQIWQLRDNNQYSSCPLQLFFGEQEGGGWGGSLFEAGRLLTFPSYRKGTYLSLGAQSNKYGKCHSHFF